jgi:hypothetical protein
MYDAGRAQSDRRRIRGGGREDVRLPPLLAVISASPMFGNLSSFVWNRVGSARSKVLSSLQACVLVCLLAVAFSPRSMVGAWVLVGSVISGRLLIAGVITARSVT